MKPYELSVVMPVYNEAEAIGPVLKKWMAMLDTLGIRYRIRAYNDGSKDATGKILAEVAEASGGRVLAVDKPNSGHGPTILRGYREAAEDSEWVFQIDSDDEMGPESFPELWAKREDYDFLVGRRDGRRQPLARKVVSFVSRLSVRLFYGKGIWDVNTPYRLMRAEVFAPFYAQIPDDTFAPNVILSGLAARHRLRLLEIPVPQHDRTTGEVSIKKWKLLKAAARSFAQTILFAFAQLGKEPSCVLERVLACCACGAGIVFCIFLLCGPYHFLAAIAAMTLAALLCWCLRWRIMETVVRHPWLTLLGICMIGVLVRLGFLVFTPAGINMLERVSFDAGEYWARSVALVEGGPLIVYKSWGTLLYYAGFIRVLGAGNLAALLAVLTSSVLLAGAAFLCGRRWLGTLGGLLFALLLAVHPFFVFFSSMTLSENLYATTVLLAFWGATRAYDAQKAIRACGWAAFYGVCAWAAVWIRSEGILVWLVLPLMFVVAACVRRCSWKRVACFFAIGAILFAAGGTLAIRLNERQNGARTIFCSNDNLWPRLFGLYGEGRYDAELRTRLEMDYRASEGLPPSAPIEMNERFAAFMKSTIESRREALSPREHAALLLRKAQLVWWPLIEGSAFLNLLFGIGVCLTALTAGLCFVVLALHRMTVRHVFMWGGALYLFANVLLLCLTEASFRYGVASPLFLSAYGAAFLAIACKPGE